MNTPNPGRPRVGTPTDRGGLRGPTSSLRNINPTMSGRGSGDQRTWEEVGPDEGSGRRTFVTKGKEPQEEDRRKRERSRDSNRLKEEQGKIKRTRYSPWGTFDRLCSPRGYGPLHVLLHCYDNEERPDGPGVLSQAGPVSEVQVDDTQGSPTHPPSVPL